MDRVQRTGGTFGILAGIALALLFVVFATTRISPAVLAEPAQAIPAISQAAGRLRLIGLLGELAVAFSVPFAVGLYLRVRGGAPTRATTGLVFIFAGLIGHGLGSLFAGVAFPYVAGLTDQTVQVPAYHALLAADRVVDTFGNGFTGAGDALFGWAVLSTGALPGIVGWLLAAAGVVSLLVAFLPEAELVFIGSLVLLVAALVWGGAALRRAAA